MNSFKLTINALEHFVNTDPATPLLYVLRNDLGLTGTKAGCSLGQCGACTVLLEGKAERACLLPTGSVVGKPITTIEGLDGHALQVAFIDEQAVQCGYCIPGIIMSAAALLKEKPKATLEDIKVALKDNICRCGSHTRILRAIYKVTKEHDENS